MKLTKRERDILADILLEKIHQDVSDAFSAELWILMDKVRNDSKTQLLGKHRSHAATVKPF